MIAGIVVIFKLGLLYRGYDEYCEDGTNCFGDCDVEPGDIINVSGKVYDISQKEFYGTERMTITLSDVTWEDNGRKLTRKRQYIVVYTDCSKVYMGQRLLIEGKLKYFEKATNEGQFDAFMFYRNRGVLFAVDKAYIKGYGQSYSGMKELLYQTKIRCEKILDDKLEAEDAAIVKAMILGMKGDIDTEVKESFQKNGIAHILAISGLHISFLCMTLYNLLKKMRIPNPVCVAISTMFLIMYIVMVGFSASAFRAACMFIMYLLSLIFKRTYDIMTALSVAAILLLLSNPGYLFDTSFQLSFMAILAVGFFYKSFIDNICNIYKIPGKISVWLLNGFCVSCMVFIATMPVLLNCYYEIPVYSVLLNLLIIPLMSVLLVSAIFIIILTATVDSLTFIPVFITTSILWVYKSTCNFLEGTGLGRINLGKPDSWKVIIFYIVLIFICNYCGKHKRKVFMGGILIMVALMSVRMPHNTRLVMLDVGQGDCFVFFNDNNNVYIFDGGSTSVKGVGEKRIIPYLKSQGVKKVEGIFVSHPDEDHMNGIEELLEKSVKECIKIEHLYIYDGLIDSEDYAGIFASAKELEVDVHGIKQKDKICDKSLQIECLYPQKGISEENKNDLSLVMRLQYGDFVFLETGDIESDKEEEIVDSNSRKKADVLKVAHHGSSSSTSKQFLEWAAPDIALISAGKDNRYGHPHSETIEILEKHQIRIYCTIDKGEVILYTDGEHKPRLVCPIK